MAQENLIKVGNVVQVINDGATYSTYSKWFEENDCKHLEEYYNIGIRKTPIVNALYRVVAVGKHRISGTDMYAIQSAVNKQVFLIGAYGIKLFNDLILMKDFMSLTEENTKQREELEELRKEVKELRTVNDELRKDNLDLISHDLLNEEQREAITWYCELNDFTLVWVCNSTDDDIEITFMYEDGKKFTKKGQSLCADIMEDIKYEMDEQMENNEFDKAKYLFDLYRKCAEWWV